MRDEVLESIPSVTYESLFSSLESKYKSDNMIHLLSKEMRHRTLLFCFTPLDLLWWGLRGLGRRAK